MADPVNLQYQVRQNSEELQDFLKDLYKWEEDVKGKDRLLANSASTEASCHPIRNRHQKKKPKSKAPKHGGQTKPRIKGFDFESWNKYDVDKALKELDEQEELQTQTTSDEDEDTDEEVVEHQKMQEALFEKEMGNDLFKEGKYEAAINRYTTAIGLDPYNAILPANRAMALIKVHRYGAAIQDCDAALALDNTYIKAYARRASAKLSLGRLEESRADYERILELQPGNKQAIEGIERVKKMLTKKARETLANVDSQKDTKNGQPVKKPMKRYIIEEIGTASSDEDEVDKNDRVNASVKTEKQNTSKPVRTEAEHTENLKTSEVRNSSNKQLEDSPHAVVSAFTTTDRAAIHDSLTCDLSPPVSSIQFETTWKRLEKNPDLLYKYLKGIPPERLPKVLGESVESSLLIKILSVILEFYVRDQLPIFTELKYISQVKRFSMILMFLSAREQTVIKSLFDYLSKIPDEKMTFTAEELENLKLKYGIR